MNNLMGTNCASSMSTGGNLGADVHRGSNHLFSASVFPENNESVVFTVNSLYVVLTAFGLVSGAKFLIYAIDPSDRSLRTPLYDAGGNRVALTASNTRIVLDVEGAYIAVAEGVERYSASLLRTESALHRVVPTAGSVAVGSSVKSAAYAASISPLYAYTNANALVPFPLVRVNTLASDTAVIDTASTTVHPVDGVYVVRTNVRVSQLSGGTYFRVSIMSGPNTVKSDEFRWTSQCSVTAVSMMVEALTSSSLATNKDLHVQYATDADTSSAFFSPTGTDLIVYRVG